MARNSKYDWPDDQKLQALLDEYGTVETARQVGCPPSALKNRIRKRGLGRPRHLRMPDAPNGNGRPEAASSNGKPEAATSNREPKPSEAIREPKQSREPDDSRSRTRESFGYLGSADYRAHVTPGHPDPVDAGIGNDDSAPAQRASGIEGAIEFLRRVPRPIWRVLAVVGLAAVAGIAAFISVSNDPKTYEREASFAVRPSPAVPPAAVNDVLGTLAQPDSAITETIVNIFGSPRLRTFAARSAGIPPGSVGGSGAEYAWSATRRTGSTIIDMRLTGPDDDKLRAMQTAAGPEAARLVEQSYSPYRLETLSAPSPPTQVGPKITRTVGLALLLGALLGIILVLVERRLRSSVAEREWPSRAPPPRGESWER
ncbi:MAG TPA: hypothetical protein VIZ61_09030 [Solirubrobacterales bacterium]